MNPLPLPFDRLTTELRRMGQEHLLRFWPRLDPDAKNLLAQALTAIDWDQIPMMRRLINDPTAATDSGGALIPAAVARIDAATRRLAMDEGHAAIAAGKVAVLLVAGGQGSRLGFNGPKGAFPIGPVSGASLFEVHARKILALEQAHHAAIPLLIMTSRANDAESRAWFERHRHFGLNPGRVHFFTQGMLPAMLPDGRLVLETPGRLFLAPDGHGGILAALQRSGLFRELAVGGVETLFYFQVDNPMVRIADPFFIGFHRLQRAQASVKVCAKRSPDEGLGVVTVRDGKTRIVEYSELTAAQKNERLPDGSLRFGAGSVAIHAFDLEFLAHQAGLDLPLHLAFKKIPVCDDAGLTRTPDAPNGYKFERFIFDVLPRAERVAIVPFDRTDEFAPVKNAAGEDSPASARLAMIARDARRLEAGGVDVQRDINGVPRFAVEIDPLFAADTTALRQRLDPDFRIERDTLLA